MCIGFASVRDKFSFFVLYAFGWSNELIFMSLHQYINFHFSGIRASLINGSIGDLHQCGDCHMFFR